MFKWFWTSFSLGAPDKLSHEIFAVMRSQSITMHFNDKATRLERKKIFHSTNLSWIHDDALALHQSVSPATPYKRLQASAASWYQIPLQMLVPGNEIKHMLDLSKILETA